MGEIVSGARRIATDQMLARASQAASGLASVGVGPGDSVALYLRNDLPFFEASFAAGRLGAYATPVNWHYTEDEARYLFENSGAKAIVIHADLVGPIVEAIPAGVAVLVVATPPEIVNAYGITAGRARVPRDAREWHAWLRTFPPRAAVAADPPGTIIYTSGTTGRPKGVRRTPPTAEQTAIATSILCRGFGFTEWLEEPDGMIVAVVGPMYHSAPNAYG